MSRRVHKLTYIHKQFTFLEKNKIFSNDFCVINPPQPLTITPPHVPYKSFNMEKGCIQRKILRSTPSHSVMSSSGSVQISTVAKESHASYTLVLYILFLGAKVT